jgi:hypothetical protein
MHTVMHSSTPLEIVIHEGCVDAEMNSKGIATEPKATARAHHLYQEAAIRTLNGNIGERTRRRRDEEDTEARTGALGVKSASSAGDGLGCGGTCHFGASSRCGRCSSSVLVSCVGVCCTCICMRAWVHVWVRVTATDSACVRSGVPGDGHCEADRPSTGRARNQSETTPRAPEALTAL